MFGCLTLAFTSCDDAMDEITSVIFDRNFAPVDFEANNIGEENATLQWTASSGATSYTLEVFADDSLTFDGDLTLRYENLTDTKYVLSQLTYDTKYSARVMAKDANDASRDSKWSEVYFRTSAQQIFFDVTENDVADTWAQFSWPAGEDVTTIVATPTAGGTPVSHELTTDEKETGKVKLEGLAPETAYTVRLLNGEKERGSKNITTIMDLAGATPVHATADLDFKKLLEEATEGQVFALFGGTFEIKGIDEDTGEEGILSAVISKSITIKGVYPTNMPVIKGRFEINGAQNFALNNVIVDGSANSTGDQAFNFKASATTLKVENSEIKNFTKGVMYLANLEMTVNEVTFNNCLIHDILCTGGDMFDMRTARVDFFNLKNSTLYNSASGRDFIRMDDAGLGGNPEITVDHCTINNVTNNKSKRLLYVRYPDHKITWTNNIVSNTEAIFSNQSKTNAPTFANNFYFNANNMKVDKTTDPNSQNVFTDVNGTWNKDPQYGNAENGDFTIGSDDVKKAGAGDPRWIK